MALLRPTLALFTFPEIQINDGNLLNIIELAEEAIVAMPGDPQVFQRGGMLVRLKRIETKTKKRGIARPAQALIIAEAGPVYLRCEMARTARYLKYDAKKAEWVLTDPPMKYAAALAEKAETFKTLMATIETPTLRDDGSILQKFGYDEASGLYFDSDFRFPEIPNDPSPADAAAALAVLREPLKDFPFIDKAAESVALAAILTALVRRSLSTAPMFLYDAPTSGSGKTLLARVVAIIATGREPVLTSYTSDAEESRKRIITLLVAGDSVVLFDNVDEPLEGETLCAVLTAPTYEDRLLGTNTKISAPTCVTFLATGNNIKTKGDMRTRVLVCRIDPETEKPEERHFDYDLLANVDASRTEFVAAALTIMRAYIVAGRPKQDLNNYGRFEEWSEMVRAPLVWLGCDDPCASREQVRDDDVELEVLATLVAALHQHFGSDSFTVSQVVKAATKPEDGQFNETAAALKDALSPFTWKGEISSRSVGKTLGSHKDRIISGLAIRKMGNPRGSSRWRIEPTPTGQVWV